MHFYSLLQCDILISCLTLTGSLLLEMGLDATLVGFGLDLQLDGRLVK